MRHECAPAFPVVVHGVAGLVAVAQQVVDAVEGEDGPDDFSPLLEAAEGGDGGRGPTGGQPRLDEGEPGGDEFSTVSGEPPTQAGVAPGPSVLKVFIDNQTEATTQLFFDENFTEPSTRTLQPARGVSRSAKAVNPPRLSRRHRARTR
jgi:hypothetical protein